MIDYLDVFSNISVSDFLENDYLSNISSFINDNYGFGKFQELVRKHPDVFAHISEERDFFALSTFLQTGKDPGNRACRILLLMPEASHWKSSP